MSGLHQTPGSGNQHWNPQRTSSSTRLHVDKAGLRTHHIAENKLNLLASASCMLGEPQCLAK